MFDFIWYVTARGYPRCRVCLGVSVLRSWRPLARVRLKHSLPKAEPGCEAAMHGTGTARVGRARLLLAQGIAVLYVALGLRLAGRVPLLARSSGADVGARVSLQLVQLLRELAQHTGTQVRAPLGHASIHAAGRERTCQQEEENACARALLQNNLST